MASYSSPSISGYNQNPPPDDGSQQATNEVTWDTIKTKLPDPIKDYAEAIDSATSTAFTTVDSQILNNSADYAADTGAADAYVVTLSPAPSAYATGMVIRFKAANANTGASTINVNGIGAKNIKTYAIADLDANAILANGIYTIVYDGTQFQLVMNRNNREGVFVSNSDGSVSESTTYLTLTDATLAEDTWEGVGPTGSGEANIWTALDNVPTSVDWIEVFVRTEITNGAGAGAGMSIHARSNGSSAAIGDSTEFHRSFLQATGATAVDFDGTSVAKIPVVSGVFDISWNSIGTVPSSFILRVKLTGYGWN